MTLLLVAVFWFLFALAAGSLIGKHFDLLGSDTEQEGEAAAGRPPATPAVASALGNADKRAPGRQQSEDTSRRSLSLLRSPESHRPLLALIDEQRAATALYGPSTRVQAAPQRPPVTFPDGSTSEVTRSLDVFADLAAAPGDDTPDAA
jgi:hypothetical protein